MSGRCSGVVAVAHEGARGEEVERGSDDEDHHRGNHGMAQAFGIGRAEGRAVGAELLDIHAAEFRFEGCELVRKALGRQARRHEMRAHPAGEHRPDAVADQGDDEQQDRDRRGAGARADDAGADCVLGAEIGIVRDGRDDPEEDCHSQ